MRFCMVLIALLLLAPLTAAQDPDAPHPTPDVTTLYAHHRDGDDEAVGWMNTDIADADSTDIAMGAQANAVTERSWRLVLAPATIAEITLDGDITVTAHMGGGSARGVWSVSTDILVDGTSIATGEEQDITLEPSDAEYPVVSWTIPVSTTVPVGAELAWTLDGSGVATAVFLGVHADRGKSSITLPITAVGDLPAPPAPAAATVYHELGDDLAIDLTWENSTRLDVHNWTTDGGLVQADVSGDIAAGEVVLRIMADGQSVFEQAFQGEINESLALEVPAGTWNVSVQASNATGHLRIDTAPGPDAGADDDDAMEGEGNNTDADGVTADAAAGKDSPAIGFLAVHVLAVIALLRRR